MAIIKVKTGGITADAITDALIADDVVGTEHLTANEVDTTALGADAVTGAQLADDAVSDEHLDVTSITGQTAETSIADGDTILIHDASASALRKMTKANFVSGIGGANTPRISVDKTGSSQSISATSWTKVTLNTERVDSDNAFTSNTFTVPSGKGGDYYMSAFAMVTDLGGTSDYATLRLANSGNSATYNSTAVAGNSGYGWVSMAISCIRTLSAGDTVSLYVYSSEAISVNEDNANLTVIKLI